METLGICKAHNAAANYFCTNNECQKLACIQCVKSMHVGHSLILMEDLIRLSLDTVNTELATHSSSAKERNEKRVKKLQTLHQKLRDLENTKKSTIQRVNCELHFAEEKIQGFFQNLFAEIGKCTAHAVNISATSATTSKAQLAHLLERKAALKRALESGNPEYMRDVYKLKLDMEREQQKMEQDGTDVAKTIEKICEMLGRVNKKEAAINDYLSGVEILVSADEAKLGKRHEMEQQLA